MLPFAAAAAAGPGRALLRQLAAAAATAASTHGRALAAAGTSSSRSSSTPSNGASCRTRRFSSSAEPEPLPRPLPTPRVQLAGQPTPATHPELLRPDELTPGVTAREFRQRRQRLAAAMPQGAVAVLPSAATAYVTGVIPYDADFAYLTGLQQHGVALIVGGGAKAAAGGGEPRFILFIPDADRERERWDGAWVGPEAAREVFGADEVYSTHDLPRRLLEIAGAAPTLLFDFDRPGGYEFGKLRAAVQAATSSSALSSSGAMRPGGSPSSSAAAGSSSPAGGGGGSPAGPRVQPLRPLLQRLRWRKSGAELRLMRTSALVAGAAVARCIGISRPGVHEGVLAATFEYECKLAGASRTAYPSVVAGGPDACTIHYSRNDKRVAGGELVLMDAGCEYAGYASDVTRTWPVSGRFTGPQRDVYEVVLDARRRVLEALRPGTTLGRLHQLSVRLLSEGLQQLRVLPGMSVDAIAAQHYREFYAHSVGHYLGMDVHDTALIGAQAPLEPSVVMAIEPALYIPDHPRFGALAGIGVRIEDDVLVTPAGAQVLSDNVPVAPDAIEELVGSALDGAAAAAGFSSSRAPSFGAGGYASGGSSGGSEAEGVVGVGSGAAGGGGSVAAGPEARGAATVA